MGGAGDQARPVAEQHLTSPEERGPAERRALVVVGEWNREEVVAAAIAAALAASIAEVARARTGFAARIPLRDLAVLPQNCAFSDAVVNTQSLRSQ